MTSISLRIPVDAVDSMKAIAPLRGFSGYQAFFMGFFWWWHRMFRYCFSLINDRLV